MSSLLTWNGIPPQIIGSLTEQQQISVVSYADKDKKESYPDWKNVSVEALQPFAAITLGVASSFMRWGASPSHHQSINLISSYLEKGEATFMSDLSLHSDARDAIANLREDGLLYMRLLCVSSMPSTFIDLTDQENMDAVLDPHRINDGRFYRPELLSLAETKGQTVRPKPWDVIVFDATTPHDPVGALQPHRRILQHAWIEMRLPSDWLLRTKNGDVPMLQPA